MKISHDKQSLLVREFYYPDIATRKCIHITSFLCWFAMIFIGTTIIGVGTSNSSITYPFCDEASSFCTQNILVESSTQLYFYLKLSNYHQNNRMLTITYAGSWMPTATHSFMEKSTILPVAATSTPTEVSAWHRLQADTELHRQHRPIPAEKP
jgi:hypothetical protein